jgi:hypothetical protein
MRAFFAGSALIIALTFIPRPAAAATCGPSSDVAAVERGTVGNLNAHLRKGWKKINNSYIMAVVVLGTYAQVDVAYAGQMSDYWIKKSGNWALAGTQAPKGWPSAIRAKLIEMSNARANGSKQCTNPSFVPRGSGG